LNEIQNDILMKRRFDRFIDTAASGSMFKNENEEKIYYYEKSKNSQVYKKITRTPEA